MTRQLHNALHLSVAFSFTIVGLYNKEGSKTNLIKKD